MGEVKRVFHKKMWILIAVAVLGNLCLFLYSELAGRSLTEMFFAAGQYQKLVERYENMSLEQAQERLGTEFSNIRKYAKILKQENSQEETKNTAQNEMQNSQTAENAAQKQTSEELLSEVDEGSREMIAYHQSLTAQQQTQLELQLKQLRSKLEYLNGYETSIDTVMANAENMKRFRIFSKQNTFSYSNILRTAQDFERVQNVELKLDNDKGADAFVHYNLMYYIAAALMVAVIYSLFDERENGMWQIVHNTPNGRTVLALKRLLLLAGGSFAILFLLYGTTFLTAMLLYGGVKDLTNPVQTFVDFYQYGLEIFMDGVLETLLLVVLGILWGRFWQSICFIVSFTVLRSFTGGYHAATKVRCAGATVGLYILNLTAAGELDSHFTAVLLLAAVGTGIIWWLAPVPHANKPLDGEQVVINRKKSRFISMCYLLGVFVSKSVLAEVGDIVAMTLFETAILILIQKGVRKYEESFKSC